MADCEGKDNYEAFFKEIEQFKERQQKQKQSGLNDYNILNVVRKENEEVGLHSKVIYSLIDPDGLHYQGDLFLRLFIKHVLVPALKKESDYEAFGEKVEVNSEEATKENRRIDFTLKSDKYFVGIEMKIDAGDLENQLSDYKKDLEEKARKDNNQQVVIFYLTKNGTEADESSSNGIDYKRISFKGDILKWIEHCQKEVQNITNLNQALEDYKTIVKKITNQYSSNIDSLHQYLLDKEDLFFDAQKFYHAYENSYSQLSSIEREVYRAYEKARKKITEDFFGDKLSVYLEKELDSEYSIESHFNCPEYKYLIRIKKGDNIIEFGSNEYGTNADYYKINNGDSLSTEYKYRNAEKSVNAFYKEEAKKYYLEKIREALS